ncbi:MAG: LD-carboxypeptidase [Anaerovoracaceae bacterium]
MKLTKSKELKIGDTIGIPSPSSGLWERSDLLSAVENIEKMGYKTKLADNVYDNTFYLAGTDEARAKGVMDMFKDDDVDAIFCSQGGYGSARLWKHLDFDIIKNNPKIFLGFSDITALHMAIHKKTGLVTFHGPNACCLGNKEYNEFTKDHMFKALNAKEPIGSIEMANKEKYLSKISSGRVTAEVIGGNISLICGTLGTEYEIDTKGKILFIEDVGLEPWIMDHLMTHLYNAGKFHDSVGIVVGESTDCLPNAVNPGFWTERSFESIVYDVLGNINKPVLYNLPIGHTAEMVTIPEGVMATLDATNKSFVIEEAGVK